MPDDGGHGLGPGRARRDQLGDALAAVGGQTGVRVKAAVGGLLVFLGGSKAHRALLGLAGATGAAAVQSLLLLSPGFPAVRALEDLEDLRLAALLG